MNGLKGHQMDEILALGFSRFLDFGCSQKSKIK